LKIYIVLIALTLNLFAKEQTIVFAAGCFWGVEKHFESLKGVRDVVVGYAGGNYKDPTYKKVLFYRDAPKGIVNYAEAAKVIYDDSLISTKDLIKSFWQLHDPTQKNRQGNDYGNNYRSAIYYTTDKQKDIAFKTKKEYQKLLTKAGYGKITTEIKPLKKFYKAKEHHQNYLSKHPKGYCPNHSTGVKFNNFLTPIGGHEIVVIDSKFCPYCQKFKDDVLSKYHGSIPLRVAKEEQLKAFRLKAKIIGTPTVLFIKDGKEQFRYRGYIDSKEFYKALALLKFGKSSKVYDIAYNKSTESKFCKKYNEFKNRGDGVFVDKISNDILFDTKDRFNSHSGWLSFYKAVDGATEFKEDNSYGMHRVEVVAKKSGAHLGHVFNRSDGKKRFCINANVLKFIPRKRQKGKK